MKIQFNMMVQYSMSPSEFYKNFSGANREKPDETVSLIAQKLSGKTENKIIAFKQNFDSKEYEDYIKREG